MVPSIQANRRVGRDRAAHGIPEALPGSDVEANEFIGIGLVIGNECAVT